LAKNINKYLLALFVTTIFLYSCSPTKYVGNNKYIVDKVEIEIDGGEGISISKMKKIAKPVPLKKIMGLYSFRARVYNLVDPSQNLDRVDKKQKKLDRKNAKIEKKIQRDNLKLMNKRNKFLNLRNDLYAAGDSVAAREAELKYLEFKREYEYRSNHLTEVRDNNYKKNVFTIADFILNNGQKPEVYDTVLVNYTKRQFKVFLRNQGYFNAIITDSVKQMRFRKKRVKVTYFIDPGEPLTIGSVAYNFPDSTTIEQVVNNNPSLKFKPGKKIDIDELEAFRNNIAEYFRNNGYYYFTKQLISFQIDTTNNKYDNAALIVNFNNSVDKKKVYSTWNIRNIRVFNDYSPNLALQDSNYFNRVKRDTFISDEGYKFVMFYKKREIIEPKFIAKEIYLFPDSIYKLNSTKISYSHLSKFKIYKLTNIQFTEVHDSTVNLLDCDIKLVPDKVTDLTFDIVATRNSLNFGGAANSVFTHRNLSHGGEVLDMMVEIALEHQKTNDTVNTNFLNTQEYSFDLKLTIPRLLIPFKSSNFIKRNNPKTIISTLFSYQNRPEYDRVQILARMDYYLKSSDFASHLVTPIRISSIKADLTPDFQDWVERAMLQESYGNHLIVGSNYSYTFTNQGATGNNFYLQTNSGVSGNLIYALMNGFNADTVNGVYVLPILESQFAQFIKSDVDYRYFFRYPEHQVVMRFFAGVGLPFGNSKLLPFGERYFVGGANSIRAWQARTLGPGQYIQPDDYKYINQTADIKLEFNFEYRFNIINYLEGAIFLDIGNIWNINSYDTRDGGVFYIDNFYKQLAYGTGFGARLNFGYFIFRTDIGLKLVDPVLPEKDRFVYTSSEYSTDNFFSNYTVLNIAIGYPF